MLCSFVMKSSFRVVIFTTFAFLLIILVIDHQVSKAKSKWSIFSMQPQLNASTCGRKNLQHVSQQNEALPRGIVQKTSDLQLRPLDLAGKAVGTVFTQKYLLAIAAGIKQKENVNAIVKKFPAQNFTIMVFHYDGVVDQWHDLSWSHDAIHVVAMKQTKWWFAKRFLHPDVVAPYDYIFVWDEDLGVDNFDAIRYLTIMQKEGLEVSQPALGRTSLEIHHSITVRQKGRRVHRRIHFHRKKVHCYHNSTGPPCAGYVEVMAPVFSRASWRCFWTMIQNDLVQGWGLDFKVGYCAQGNRTEKVGVIDEEYVIHQAIPSLGDSIKDDVPTSSENNLRYKVRQQSYKEMRQFVRRWNNAVQEDNCWVDPYYTGS